MKKTAKIILWIVSVFIVLLMLSVGIFAYLFVSKNPEITPAKLNDMDYFTGAKISQQILYRTLKSKKSSEIRTIKINNGEMASLMNLAENGESLIYLVTGRKPQAQQGRNDVYKIFYDRGIYTFKVRLTDLWCNLCFVANGRAEIRYNNGKIDIRFLSLKLGRTELPQKYKEEVKKYIYDYLKNDRVYDAVRASVLKVEEQPGGGVKVYYYPYRLRKYFSNNVF